MPVLNFFMDFRNFNYELILFRLFERAIINGEQGWNLTLALGEQNIGRTSVNAPASHPAGDLIKIPGRVDIFAISPRLVGLASPACKLPDPAVSLVAFCSECESLLYFEDCPDFNLSCLLTRILTGLKVLVRDLCTNYILSTKIGCIAVQLPAVLHLGSHMLTHRINT